MDLKRILASHAAWLLGGVGERADLGCADLSGAYLSGAYLSNADLRRSILGGTNLMGATLNGADLSGAYMSGANLRYSTLSGANLSGANLVGATLTGADLSGADLSKADLCGVAGNMREVRSAQLDMWPLTWTRSPDGETTLQIGCCRHPLGMWIKSDPRWIDTLDLAATDWWRANRDMVLRLVGHFPATPHGKVEK